MTREVDARATRIIEARALLRHAAEAYSPAALASSFGAEDMVLIDMIGRGELPISVFTLDTGRLPAETHDLIERVRSTYGLAIDVYFPEAAALEPFVRAHGVNAFYESTKLRERCCEIRKTQPLARALAGKRAWVTGLRRGQGITRRGIDVLEHDDAHAPAKFNPLADWSRDDVWSYLREHRVPWNALHDRGYASIGCAPCTRAIEPGEHERAGRWWWESSERRECGLHRRPSVVPLVHVDHAHS